MSLERKRIETAARLALVDDHALFREGLRAVVERDPVLRVVGEAADHDAALQLVSREQLDVAVVDLGLPGPSGIAVTREIVRLQPRCRVLLLSMVDEPYRVAEALRAGAFGYALKSQPTTEIVDAIRTVLGGVRYLAPRLSRDEIEALIEAQATGPLDRLSPREREVFRLLVRGRRSSEIAVELQLAERTVETHREHILAKLGLHSVVELARLAARHGLLEK